MASIQPIAPLPISTIRKLWPKFSLYENSDAHVKVSMLTSDYMSHLEGFDVGHKYLIEKSENITITFNPKSEQDEIKMYFTKGEYVMMTDGELIKLYSGLFDNPEKYLLWMEMKQ